MFSAITAGSAQAQQKQKILGPIDVPGLPPGFDCSTIHEKGIDKQDNMRAGLIMIACGLSQGGSPPTGSQFFGNGFTQWIKNLLPGPLLIGGSDVDVILPDGSYPHVTQSESMEWGGPNNTWVVNYNDSRTGGACYGGLSYSTDNGVTWHASSPLCSGHGTNYGDPIVVYNARLGMWFAGDLVTGVTAAARASACGPRLTASPGPPARARTTAAKTTARACGWITTRPAHSTDECTSPATISPPVAATLRYLLR